MRMDRYLWSMRIKTSPQPKLGLVDLLRRRRMTLQDWLNENVVNTYDDLLAWCQLVGVVPPSFDEWEGMKPQQAPVQPAHEKQAKPTLRSRRETQSSKDASGPSSSQAGLDPSSSLNE